MESSGKLRQVQSVKAEDVVPGKNHRLSVYDKDNGLSFLVDTGANVSLIPVTYKQKHSGKCLDYKLFAANNSEIKTYGTRTLNINLRLRRQFRWTFIITDVNQAILGADFLEFHGLIVNLKAKKLIDKKTNLLTVGKIVNCDESSVSTVESNHPFLDILSKFPDITKPVSFKNLYRPLYRDHRKACTCTSPSFAAGSLS